MNITCVCEKQKEFIPQKSDEKRLKDAISKKSKFIIITCGECKKSIPINPETLEIPEKSLEKKYHCITVGCDGLIVHVIDNNENFWGCGECGNVWDDDGYLKAQGAILA